MDLQERFLRFLRENNLCDPQGDRVLLAVSGGRDSMLMMHLFLKAGIEVGVAHCNFALRGSESEEDEAFVRACAHRAGVPFFVKRFDTEQHAALNRTSIQMAARELRYAWFESLRARCGYDSIAVAHHARDNVETVLINVLRGTGVRGLAGMPARRDRIIRPLLFLRYEEITAAISRYGLPFREDSSNHSTAYLRNKLRLEVIPILQEIHPGLESTFAQNMDTMRDWSAFVDGQIERYRATWLTPYHSGGYLLDLSAVQKIQPLTFVLYELLEPFGFTPPVCSDLADVLQRNASFSGRQFYSSTHVLWLDREQGLIRSLEEQVGDPPIELSPDRPLAIWNRQRLDLSVRAQKHATIHDAGAFAQFDADQIAFPLQVRSWQTGDTFRPRGMGGRSKKVSDYLVSRKVPVWDKSQIPVVVDLNGTVLWIAPWRMSNDYNISSETKNVLTISYFCGDGG